MKAFRQAAAGGDVARLKSLYADGSGLNSNEAGSESGKTALHWAAQKGHVPVVQFLLGLKGIGVDSQDKNGNTPLNLLIQSEEANLNQKLLIIDCLLKHGADPLLENKEGKTPFNYFLAKVNRVVIAEGSHNQRSFVGQLMTRIKDFVTDKAWKLGFSAAIRQDGTVVFGETTDLLAEPRNYSNLQGIGIIGIKDSEESKSTLRS